MRKLSKLLGGLAVVLVGVALAAWHGAALFDLAWNRLPGRPVAVAGVSGFTATLLLFLHRPPFIRLYVFLHECTHALAAMLCGRRVRRLRIGREGGSIEVERPNAFIALAPYIIPLPLIVAVTAVTLLAVLGGHSMPVVGAAIAGAALGWHICHTLTALRTGQPDLHVAGPIRSITWITAANLAMFYWLCAALLTSPAPVDRQTNIEASVRALVASLSELPPEGPSHD